MVINTKDSLNVVEWHPADLDVIEYIKQDI